MGDGEWLRYDRLLQKIFFPWEGDRLSGTCLGLRLGPVANLPRRFAARASRCREHLEIRPPFQLPDLLKRLAVSSAETWFTITCAAARGRIAAALSHLGLIPNTDRPTVPNAAVALWQKLLFPGYLNKSSCLVTFPEWPKQDLTSRWQVLMQCFVWEFSLAMPLAICCSNVLLGYKSFFPLESPHKNLKCLNWLLWRCWLLKEYIALQSEVWKWKYLIMLCFPATKPVQTFVPSFK